MIKQIRELLDVVVQGTGWTEEEARAFIRAIRSDTEEGLFEDIPSAIEIAKKAEMMAFLIDLMKRGAIIARVENGELSVRLPPNTKVEKLETGLRVIIEQEHTQERARTAFSGEQE